MPREKEILWHMRTAKGQIRLRICAVWSRPSLSTYRIGGWFRLNLCACASWSECLLCAFHIWAKTSFRSTFVWSILLSGFTASFHLHSAPPTGSHCLPLIKGNILSPYFIIMFFPLKIWNVHKDACYTFSGTCMHQNTTFLGYQRKTENWAEWIDYIKINIFLIDFIHVWQCSTAYNIFVLSSNGQYLVLFISRNENTPIQINRKFHIQKLNIFRW